MLKRVTALDIWISSKIAFIFYDNSHRKMLKIEELIQ